MNWTETKYDGMVEWTADRGNFIFVIEWDLSDEYIASALSKITDTTGYPFSRETFPTLEDAKRWCRLELFDIPDWDMYQMLHEK